MGEKNSYGQILKSSSIMGGSASITMILGMVKTKFAAVLIGTGGVGLLASFTAIQGLIGTLAGLGINQSAVRDIAAAVSKGDQQAIGRSVLTLRRMCWLTGLLGMGTLIIVSPLIGQFTFGSDKHNLEIAALGLVILFVNITGGQTALIQGSRRIGDIARLQILGAAVGTVITIGFYYWIGLRGIVPALVLASALQLIISWRYALRVAVPKVEMTWAESVREAGSMIKLGLAMMWTGLLISLVAYATVAMITDRLDLQSVGIYSAAFALSGMFVNFVLQAMGADYYPRLVGVAHDKAAMNRLVNEQTEIGLLLAVPGILATLVLAPWVIQLFYTEAFLPAVHLLQWFILGCFVRVIQWPMGFLQIALGKSLVWFSTQTLFSIIHIVMIWIGIQMQGLEGVSMAFSVSYFLFIGVILLVARKLTGFAWSLKVKRLVFILSFTISIDFLLVRFSMVGAGITIVIALVCSVYCLRKLVFRLGEGHSLTRLCLRIPGMKYFLIESKGGAVEK